MRCRGCAEAAAAALAHNRLGADDAYDAALEAYLGSGGPDFDARLRTVADDLGLPERALDRPTSTPRVGRARRASPPSC